MNSSALPATMNRLEIQCDQIGRFFKVFGNMFFHHSCPNICLPFGQLSKTLLLRTNWCGFLFKLPTYGKIWPPMNFNLWSHRLIYHSLAYSADTSTIVACGGYQVAQSFFLQKMGQSRPLLFIFVFSTNS